nr:amidohydrolase family protein [Leucobacter exalbidus]
MHLFALAASYTSVDCRSASSPAELGSLLRTAPKGPDGSVRATGYSESLAGKLDRQALDKLAGNRSVRVQHRSGALWILSSAALRTLGLLHNFDQAKLPHPSLELDAIGNPTGRVWRGDRWLRELAPAKPPQLSRVGHELARLGITGITDASPELDTTALTAFEAAQRTGALPQRLQLLGHAASPAQVSPDLAVPRVRCAAGGQSKIGPRKIVLADHQLPSYNALVAELLVARSEGRAVAVHSVTLDSLALLLAAFEAVPPVIGDRIEHAAVIPQALVADIARFGLAVVTQPGFIAHRGDELGDDLGHAKDTDLYRVASLIRAGIPLALSSDAPYGPLSPWQVIHAAQYRRTPTGATIGVSGSHRSTYHDETIDPKQALMAYLAPLDSPGAAPRRIVPGVAADIVLLQTPLVRALEQIPRNPVRATMIAGSWIHQ